MPKITLLAATILIATTAAANAQWIQRSQNQPDFSSCSSSRDACVIGTTRRGDDQAKCEKRTRRAFAPEPGIPTAATGGASKGWRDADELRARSSGVRRNGHKPFIGRVNSFDAGLTTR
jgi:hypothetical protein